jgi:hypothetical protein
LFYHHFTARRLLKQKKPKPLLVSAQDKKLIRLNFVSNGMPDKIDEDHDARNAQGNRKLLHDTAS